MGVSYDDPKTLAAFSAKRGITFLLLSDADSKTIDAYGVRNDDARGSRLDGIPLPGTMIIDTGGVIRAKLFRAGYKKRHAPDAILEAVGER